MQILNWIGILALSVNLLANSVVSSDTEETEYCLLKDYILLNKILVKLDKERSQPNILYSHLRRDPDGQTVQVYFTSCRDLPLDIKRQCGIQDTDKRSYTFVEIFNDSLCIPRRSENIVTSRHYIKHNVEQFDIVYREQDSPNSIILNFRMVDQPSNNSVEYSFLNKQRVFNSNPSHVY